MNRAEAEAAVAEQIALWEASGLLPGDIVSGCDAWWRIEMVFADWLLAQRDTYARRLIFDHEQRRRAAE